MQTWSAMYGIIWLAYFEIILALFLPFDYIINLAIHAVIAVGLLGFAFYIYRNVRLTSCPDRIKRITRTTWNLSKFQAVLGVVSCVGDCVILGRPLFKCDKFPPRRQCSGHNLSGFVLCDSLRYVGREGIPSGSCKVKSGSTPWMAD